MHSCTKNLNPRVVGLSLFALLATLLLAVVCQAQETIRIRVVSGRTFAAQVAPRTDQQRLWISLSTGSATVLRPISWDAIVAAEYQGEELTSRQLQAKLLSPSGVLLAAQSQLSRSQEIEDFTADEVDIAPAPTEELPAPPGEREFATQADEALHVLFAKPRVASIRFDAQLANWDADVEADGLIVQVIPVDETGHVVPAAGNLRAELLGVRKIAFADGPQLRGKAYGRLGQWTRLVVPADVRADGAWYKLPFQAQHPEFDLDVLRNAVLHVTVVVPGEGVFEASVDGLRLRSFSPTRDALQRDTGRCFFPTERTGRGMRNR